MQEGSTNKMTNSIYNLSLKTKAEFRSADILTLEASKRLNDIRTSTANYFPKLKIKSRLSALFLFLVAASSRIKRLNWQNFTNTLKSKQPMLVVAWHGSLVIPIYCLRNHGIFILTSLSLDGDLLTRTLYSFGFRCVRGSSSRGGMRGLLEMVKIMKRGANCAITVDGPRGPRHKVKPGAVLLAQKANALIIPLGVAYSKCHHLNNWDRTEVPYPTSRAVLSVGKPFSITKDISLDEGCDIIKESIFACEKEAKQRICNG